MAKYKVLQRSYLNGEVYLPGDEVEYTGTPGKFLEPLDKEAETLSKAAARERKERLSIGSENVQMMNSMRVEMQDMLREVLLAVLPAVANKDAQKNG